jgi:predicted metal-binding protein
VTAGSDLGDLKVLIDRAIELGASEARVISPKILRIEDHFPDLCRPPQCDGYDRSANCPPHVMSPAEFRELVSTYGRVIVFKVDCPMEILLDEDGRDDVNRLVQDIASSVELAAVAGGLARARGLAFGSCKRIFCSEFETCNVIGSHGKCRNPDRARPSMSGLGINFNRLNASLGWDPGATAVASGLEDETMTMVVGMVLAD